MQDDLERVQQWLDAYLKAWRVDDGETAALLFSEDCSCRTLPFRQLEDARAYTRQAMASQRVKQAWFGEPLVQGSRATFEYWAIVFDLDENQEMTLAGHGHMRLDAAGRCCEYRDYWFMQPGALEPHPGWGK